MKTIKFFIKLPSLLAIKLIEVYQFTLSPDHSWLKARFPYGYCRHYPSCSQYAKESLEKFGLIKGSALSLKRIVKCNGFVNPSIDLVPNK